MKRLLVSMIICVLMVGGYALAQGVKTGSLSKRTGLTEADFPRMKELSPGVYSYEALRGGDPDDRMTTVSMIVVTSDGVLVADGQGNVEQTQRMVDDIKKITNQPIKYVVICSDHGDHTGGNSAFPESAIFVAHPTSKAIFDAQAANRRPEQTPVRVPTETVADQRTIRMGGKEIQIMFLGRAHTGGDLSVYLPQEKVLFMSEAYLHRIFPAMRSAYPSEWVAAVRKAEALNATWYIPGHGFVDDGPTLKAELPVYRRAMETVISEAKRLRAAGLKCDAPPPGARGARGGGAAAAPAADPCPAVQQANFGEFDAWTLRGGQALTALRRVYDELDGKLPR